MRFEALNGDVAIYIWFEVTSCVCLLFVKRHEDIHWKHGVQNPLQPKPNFLNCATSYGWIRTHSRYIGSASISCKPLNTNPMQYLLVRVVEINMNSRPY